MENPSFVVYIVIYIFVACVLFAYREAFKPTFGKWERASEVDYDFASVFLAVGWLFALCFLPLYLFVCVLIKLFKKLK
jgi:hypothetical protein